jgi:hypothetical protein
MKKISSLATLLLFACLLHGQTVIKQFDKRFGGSVDDNLSVIEQTDDEGYILGGTSNSSKFGDKSENRRGDNDFWIVKTDKDGNKLWDKTYGGDKVDFLSSLQKTLDGGYILGGSSQSNSSGEKTENNRGNYDYWVVKIDANGNKQWDKTFGGIEWDVLYSVLQTPDGGYILGGESDSPAGGDVSDNGPGIRDFWIIRIDKNGNKLWDKKYGGNSIELFNSLIQTTDGGYILAGNSGSDSSGDKTENNKGYSDFWIIKIDKNGTIEWDKTYGGDNVDRIASIIETTDGGYILGGTSQSTASGDKTENGRGKSDFWIIKTDKNGNKLWDKTFGGDAYENLATIKQTDEGGYVFGGTTQSEISGDKTDSRRGGDDFWIVKTDRNGNKEWDKTFGGSGNDGLNALIQTKDKGYMAAGSSGSPVSGDKSEAVWGGGAIDYWLMKFTLNTTLAAPFASKQLLFNAYPNPFKSITTIEFAMGTFLDEDVLLYNCTGQQVLCVPIDASSTINNITIDGRSLKPGTYICKVVSSGVISQIKLVILE